MEGKDFYIEKLRHVMTAMDTFRTVIGGSDNDEWVRSAYDHLLRELQTFQATEETKLIEEYRGVLRDVLEHLTEGAIATNAITSRIKGVLGILPVPPDVPPG